MFKSCNLRDEKNMVKEKYHLQEWLGGEQFNYCIVIEPTPHLPFKYNEITQRLRKISFEINKKYLGNNFTNFKNFRDRIFFVAFKEIQLNKHYNIMVSLPNKFKRMGYFIQKNFKSEFIMQWCMLQSMNPYTWKLRKMDFENNNLHIEPVKNIKGRVIYDSKKMKVFDSVDNDQTYFII